MNFNAGDIILSRPDRRTRRIQAAIMWLVTGVVSLGWMAAPGSLGDLGAGGGALTLTALLAAGGAWLTWGPTRVDCPRGSAHVPQMLRKVVPGGGVRSCASRDRDQH
jgi:hypothetical protein